MQRSTMEVEKETGANANKRGPPDGPNAAENEWPVIPVTAAAAAASLTTGQLDSTACGVQLVLISVTTDMSPTGDLLVT